VKLTGQEPERDILCLAVFFDSALYISLRTGHPYLSSEKDIPNNDLDAGMAISLDEVDRKILRELQGDGRASFRDISGRIDVSTPTVSARVQAMVEVGLIKGYSVLLDSEMLGQTTVALEIQAKPVDIQKVVERIKDDELVRQVYVLSDSRLLCIVSFFKQMKFQKFLESLQQIPEIMRLNNSMVLKTPKESPRAALTDDAGLMIKCYYCGHMMKDEGVKIKLDGKYHYLCCSVCEKLYREKYQKLKKSAGLKPAHVHSP
jgi:DNA-binding Lrp family transcriptional regulator